MTRRSKLITQLPLAALNTSLTEKELDKRVASLIRELYEDVPALKMLRASRMQDRREPQSTGLCLGIYLDETAQIGIQYPGDKSERPLVTDLFLQEVELVERQQKAIRQQLSRAVSPAVNPAGNAAVVSIRKRLKRTRRDEGFLLASGPEPERVHYGDLPKVMPRGYEANVRVRVNWISPKTAEVLIFDAVDPKGSKRNDLPCGTRIKLIREGKQMRLASGPRLLEAMDQKHDLLLKVTVALNWISGEPLFLELVNFADEQKSSVPNSPQTCLPGTHELGIISISD